MNAILLYAFQVLGAGALLCSAIGVVCLLVAVGRKLRGYFGMPWRLILLGTWRPGDIDFHRWSKENWWWREE